MKRLVLLTVWCMAGLLPGYSQVTLTSDHNVPLSPYRYVFRPTQASLTTAMITGENVTWDFSKSSQITDTTSVYYTRDPHYNSFPGISLILSYPDSTDTSYLYSDRAIYRTTSDAYYLDYRVVTSWPFGTAVVYTHDLILPFPCTYGTWICSDSVYLPNTQGVPYIIVDRRRCDAWGKLILPDTTYASTLRISGYQYTETQVNSHSCEGKITHTYNWYDAHSEVPLLSVTHTQTFAGYCGMPVITSTTLSSSQFVKRVRHPDNLSIYHPTHDLRLHLHPNPASGQFVLELPLPGEITVYSLTGVSLIRKPHSGGKTTVDISPLCDGIYLVRLTTDAGCYLTRLVKQVGR